jgi:hypothetical protein
MGCALGQNGEGNEGLVGSLCAVTMGGDLLLVSYAQGIRPASASGFLLVSRLSLRTRARVSEPVKIDV